MILAEFFVPGDARAQGSKRAFQHKATGKIIMTEGADAKSHAKLKNWRHACRMAAHQAYGAGRAPDDGPIFVVSWFVFGRPKDHYGRNGLVKPTRRDRAKTGKPDAEKLSRALHDSMTTLVWKDDSQIVGHLPRKRYGELPGVYVVVARADAGGDPVDRSLLTRPWPGLQWPAERRVLGLDDLQPMLLGDGAGS